MRLGTARIFLALLCAAHLAVTAAAVQRHIAPLRTFHDHDVRILNDTLLLAGLKNAPRLPAPHVLPPGTGAADRATLWGAALANSPHYTRSYRTVLPLHNLATALPSLALGVSPLRLRLGGLPMLWALLLIAFDLGRRLSGRPEGGLAAAIALGSLPAVHTAAVVGTPVLGNMLGAALAVWALVRSDGLRRPGWALLAGPLVALAPRWGESAGDGIEVLLVVAGPLVLSALAPLARLLRPDRRRAGLLGLLGLGLLVAGGWPLLDRWWLSLHLSRYVLVEAGGEGGSRLAALAVAPWAYPEALLWSLIGPIGLVVLGAGWLAGLRRLRLETVLLWAAALGAMAALTLSLKRQDYYIAPTLLPLCVLGGAGLSQLRWAWAWAPAVAAMSAVWLFQAHADLPPLSRMRCDEPVRALLAVERIPCGPHDPLSERQFEMYHYFRQWRAAADQQERRRMQLAAWATEGDGAAWLAALPAGGLVLLQRPSGQGGGADALYYVLQASRPDVSVHVLTRSALDADAAALLAGAPEAWLLTLVRDMLAEHARPEAPLRALAEQVEPVETHPAVHRYRITAP